MKKLLSKLGAILLALLLWQGLAMLPKLSILLASPIDVILRLGSIWKEPQFFSSLWFTFWRIVLGFGIGLVLGVGLAVLAGRFSWMETLLWPYMLTIKSVPVASFVIIVLIFFRATALSVIISALMVLPILYTNTLTGIKSTNPDLDRMATIYGIPFRKKLLYVKLPQIQPYFLSGCSVALGLSWKSGVAAELIGIPTGSVGEALYESKIYLDTLDLFCWTLLVVLVSFGFEKCFLWMAKRVFRKLEVLPCR